MMVSVRHLKEVPRMLPIRFIKAAPTTYILQFKNGKIRREGPGLAFFYYAPTSTIVTVPLESADIPFAFVESTVDFQSVTIQGQLTYRVADPKRLVSLLDFSVNSTGVFHSDDYRKLPDRLVHTAQTLLHAQPEPLPPAPALTRSAPLRPSFFTVRELSAHVDAHGV